MIIRVGSRDSILAIKQAEIVIAAIKKCDPNIQTELVTMKTTGDMILDKTLDQIGGKGLFVKELDSALLGGRVDITVHSLKDMPMEGDARLPIMALSAREDCRDALVLPLGIAMNDINFGKPIGSSSARRAVQLRALFADENCTIAPIRGNVLTRLEKLDKEDFCAITLAVAGLNRLGLQGRISRIFSPEEILPAAGQGIIAVQARAGFDTGFLAQFNSPESVEIATAERAFVRALNGGCSAPIAAFAQKAEEKLTLRGLYVDARGRTYKGETIGGCGEGEALGQALALRLKSEGK